MTKYRGELSPEEIKHIIVRLKSLMVQPPSDFEKYLIDDSLTWYLEAGETVDPAEVRASVRRYMSTRQSRQSVKNEEAPPPQQAGGDQANARSDLDIWKDVFGEG